MMTPEFFSLINCVDGGAIYGDRKDWDKSKFHDGTGMLVLFSHVYA